MRYQPFGRYEYQETNRKSAAILRSQRREREALPLFADEIAAGQLSVADVHARRRAAASANEAAGRARRAREWRQARKTLRELPADDYLRLLDHWNRHRWYPAVPAYLLTMIRRFKNGELDLAAPGMTLSRAAARQAGSLSR